MAHHDTFVSPRRSLTMIAVSLAVGIVVGGVATWYTAVYFLPYAVMAKAIKAGTIEYPGEALVSRFGNHRGNPN